MSNIFSFMGLRMMRQCRLLAAIRTISPVLKARRIQAKAMLSTGDLKRLLERYWPGSIAVTGLLLMLLTSGVGAIPQIPGWEPASEPLAYGPENLWEYINGAADHYLAYGFRELRAIDIRRGALTVTLNIYDMTTRLNAYGLYELEAPDDAPLQPYGTRSVNLPPYQALLLIDSLYIKLEVFEGELSLGPGVVHAE